MCVVRYVCVCVRFIFFDDTFCLNIILQPIVFKSCQIVRLKHTEILNVSNNLKKT